MDSHHHCGLQHFCSLPRFTSSSVTVWSLCHCEFWIVILDEREKKWRLTFDFFIVIMAHMRLSTCGSNKQSEMSSKHKCSKFVFLTCKCKGHFSAIAKARNNANNLQNDQSLLMMRDWWLGHQASFLILGENTPYFHITPQSFSRHWIKQQIWWEQFHAAFSTLY